MPQAASQGDGELQLPDGAVPLNSGYFTCKRLRRRGWTSELIDRLLPQPHILTPSPPEATNPWVANYRVEDVQRLEQSPEFREAQQQMRRRQNTIANVTERALPKVSGWRLIGQALRWKNRVDQPFEVVVGVSHAELCVQYVSWRLGRYEYALRDVAGGESLCDRNLAVACLACGMIMDRYPWLFEAVTRFYGDLLIEIQNSYQKRRRRSTAWERQWISLSKVEMLW